MSHIALVEDYFPHAQLMGMDLAEGGYQVSQYSTGEAALTAIKAGAPNLVLLDWHLPGLSGLEVCQRLRAEGYQQPILFVSAMAGEDNVRAGLAAGADGYLVKPFVPKELLGMIAHHLQKTRTPSEHSAA
ncbi:MAG: response regulator [Cyanobacteria bacterium J06638_20]